MENKCQRFFIVQVQTIIIQLSYFVTFYSKLNKMVYLHMYMDTLADYGFIVIILFNSHILTLDNKLIISNCRQSTHFET